MRPKADIPRSGGPLQPYAVDGAPDNWDRNRDDYARRVLDVWREYAINLDGDNVRAEYLFTPLDVGRLNVNMRQGAVRMGAFIPSQLGINRPHPDLSGSRSPIDGLYLCESSSGNGGGGERGTGLYRRQYDRRRSRIDPRLDPRPSARMAQLGSLLVACHEIGQSLRDFGLMGLPVLERHHGDILIFHRQNMHLATRDHGVDRPTTI